MPRRAAKVGATLPPVLGVEGLFISAGGAALLENFELALHAGQLVGLSGPSGCGKTSLLRAIAGLDPVESGRIALHDREPDSIGWPAFRRQVMLAPQRPVMFDGTIGENLRRPFAFASTGTKHFPEDRAAKLLKRLHLEGATGTANARSLSGGEQQRVSLIRAILLEPAVMLLDEPTSSLDEKTVGAVEALIREEAGHRGMAALIVTHDRAQLERWCDSVVDLSPMLVARKGDPR